MYGDLKYVEEEGFDPAKDIPLVGIQNEESMKAIVENIFKKA